MKKLKYATVYMMIAFALISISSCSDKEFDKSSQNEINLSQSNEVAISNINTSMLFSPIKLEGQFDAWVNDGNELVVLTKTDKNLHLFVVQGLKSNQIDVSNLESLTFLNKAMILDDSKQGVLYFGVVKRLPNDILGNITHKEFGYSLIHHALDLKNEFTENIDISSLKKTDNVIDYLFGSESTRSVSCNSGGPGSTACSNSYCSVECGSGYYSCCTLPQQLPYVPASCTCVKETPNQ